jgi:hypothetical protein
MAVDERDGRLWVFGGKVVLPQQQQHQQQHPTDPNYSGLYSYDIATNKWTLVRPDDAGPSDSPALKSRIGHCMVWEEERRLLHILQGQRMKDYLRYPIIV